ncbi:MAG TPA: hypothetical protein VIG99_14415 [Myxococcaceae bacterium]|jgi:hypothetical protein
MPTIDPNAAKTVRPGTTPQPTATPTPSSTAQPAAPAATPAADKYGVKSARGQDPNASLGGKGTVTGAGAAQPQAEAAGDHHVPCPMLGALESMGMLHPDEHGNVSMSEIDRAFKNDLGMSGPMRLMFQLMAPTSTNVGKLLNNVLHRNVDVDHLRGDFFDHRWDTGILKDGKFNQGAFDELKSFSKDDKTLTNAEWGAAMRQKLEEARKQGANVPTHLATTGYEAGFVTFEAGLVFSVLGKPDAQGTMRVSMDDLQRLYKDKKLPEGWSPDKSNANLRTLGSGAAQTMFGFLFGGKAAGVAQAGDRLAVGREASAAEPALTGMKMAQCPCGGKPMVQGKADSAANPAPTDAATSAQIHQMVEERRN